MGNYSYKGFDISGNGSLEFWRNKEYEENSFYEQSETRNKIFEKLQKIKLSHSKVNMIKHNVIKIQKYLQPNQAKMSKDEAQLIFRLRCRVTETKNNLKRKYTSLECRACGLEIETQEHIIICKELNGKEEVE